MFTVCRVFSPIFDCESSASLTPAYLVSTEADNLGLTRRTCLAVRPVEMVAFDLLLSDWRCKLNAAGFRLLVFFTFSLLPTHTACGIYHAALGNFTSLLVQVTVLPHILPSTLSRSRSLSSAAWLKYFHIIWRGEGESAAIVRVYMDGRRERRW